MQRGRGGGGSGGDDDDNDFGDDDFGDNAVCCGGCGRGLEVAEKELVLSNSARIRIEKIVIPS